MQLRYNYRLEPTPVQRIALAQAFGCARVVFNDAVALRNHTHEQGLPFLTDAELSRAVITEAKRRPDRAWLGGVSAVVLQQALADATTAFRNFFASLAGRRQGPKVGPPRFRSRRDNRQAIRFTRNARFKVVPGGKLSLPKIGDVTVRWSRKLPAAPSSVSVIKDAAGRYFASFVVEVAARPLPEVEAETGIDVGLGHFAVLADGRKISSPRFLRRAEKKLARLQRALSRKQKGSNNRARARIRVAAQHAKVADARREFHHRLSTTIIRENQTVVVEDLAVKGLARTRLAKSVHDAGWSSFIAMLEYKAKLHGRGFCRIDRWFPSSKLCSACGLIAEAMPLNVREWICAGCGLTHDRDVNAAVNILAAGRAERLNASHTRGRDGASRAGGGQVRPPLAVAQPAEAGSHRGAA
ncbi:RNA-guided endonuclease TnpB family protein [Nonomuraea rosea]|uniref:RNA-guided endonuclease TnpB family protein n=1 Tax=Nonomuraea rosea TaxID=638574 RepID=A0ABP7AC59_9ACTN